MEEVVLWSEKKADELVQLATALFPLGCAGTTDGKSCCAGIWLETNTYPGSHLSPCLSGWSPTSPPQPWDDGSRFSFSWWVFGIFQSWPLSLLACSSKPHNSSPAATAAFSEEEALATWGFVSGCLSDQPLLRVFRQEEVVVLLWLQLSLIADGKWLVLPSPLHTCSLTLQRFP